MNGNCKNGYQKASKTINKSLSRLFLCTQRGESKKRGRAQQASKFPLQTTQPAVLGDEQAAAFRNERERKKGTHTRTFTHTCTRGIRLFSLLSSVGESERERAWGQECAAHYRRRRDRKMQCRICAGRHLGQQRELPAYWWPDCAWWIDKLPRGKRDDSRYGRNLRNRDLPSNNQGGDEEESSNPSSGGNHTRTATACTIAPFPQHLN